MFLLSFKNGNNFNALIDNKPFFDLPVKNNQRVYEKEKLIEMSRNDDYTTEKLVNFFYHHIIKNILAQSYQNKKIRVFLKKLIL